MDHSKVDFGSGDRELHSVLEHSVQLGAHGRGFVPKQMS